MKEKLIIAVDFDGTLVTDQFPEIGKKVEEIFGICHAAKADGHLLILWTCREDAPHRAHLTEAVEFCRAHGLEFDSVNENLPDSPYNHLGKSRKVYADYYIDDKAVAANELVQ